MKNMQITPAATSIPAPILAAATAMLKPYGVDIVALLDEQQEATDTVQPLQKKYLTIKEARSYTGLGRWTLWKAEKEGKSRRSSLFRAAVAAAYCMTAPVLIHGWNPAPSARRPKHEPPETRTRPAVGFAAVGAAALPSWQDLPPRPRLPSGLPGNRDDSTGHPQDMAEIREA